MDMRSIGAKYCGAGKNGHLLAQYDVGNRSVVAVSSVAYRIFEIVPRRLTDDV